jgi:hypothetical protein
MVQMNIAEQVLRMIQYNDSRWPDNPLREIVLPLSRLEEVVNILIHGTPELPATFTNACLRSREEVRESLLRQGGSIWGVPFRIDTDIYLIEEVLNAARYGETPAERRKRYWDTYAHH